MLLYMDLRQLHMLRAKLFRILVYLEKISLDEAMTYTNGRGWTCQQERMYHASIWAAGTVRGIVGRVEGEIDAFKDSWIWN